MGTPAKLTLNGKVQFNDPLRESMITNLDALSGNSGSAVFNASQEVVGLLVGGSPSAEYEGEHCKSYNRCDDNGQNCLVPDKDFSVFPYYRSAGSEVQKIAPIVDLLKSLK